jgi:ElaB/YqjD/DUF883 family membrane-anchored ribosome-binding protein
MEQTAMNELIDEMNEMLIEGNTSVYALRETARKLLKKEKQQIKDAFNFGGEYSEEWDKAADQYYHETYGKD